MTLNRAGYWLYNPGSQRRSDVSDDHGEVLMPGRYYIMCSEWSQGAKITRRKVAAGPALSADSAWQMLERQMRAVA